MPSHYSDRRQLRRLVRDYHSEFTERTLVRISVKHQN